MEHLLRGVSPDDVGTIVYLPHNDPARSTGNIALQWSGFWAWGGIIVLDKNGRMVRHRSMTSTSTRDLNKIWRQIPAADHVKFGRPTGLVRRMYSHRAFLKRFPGALRFGQLWTFQQWLFGMIAAVVILVPIVFGIVDAVSH